MLLKALLPAPGAEYNSYLKNAYKKSQLFFPISGKLKQTNDMNNKEKKRKEKKRKKKKKRKSNNQQ